MDFRFSIFSADIDIGGSEKSYFELRAGQVILSFLPMVLWRVWHVRGWWNDCSIPCQARMETEKHKQEALPNSNKGLERRM